MASNRNRDVVTRYITGLSVMDIDVMRSLTHPDAIFDWPQTRERVKGVSQMREIDVHYPGGLPSAHAIAPSHVSAVMSGVLIKMGIYGLVRICGLLSSPPLAWGITLLLLGSVASFFGVLFALAQHDIKRLLAYHSIENIGIIVIGLGLALVGRSLGRTDWVLLGMGGALLHVWNHALFKSLLFLSAGSVVHATVATVGMPRRW